MFMRHERQTWRIPAQYKCPLLLLLLLFASTGKLILSNCKDKLYG